MHRLLNPVGFAAGQLAVFQGAGSGVGTGQISEEACLFYYAFIFCCVHPRALACLQTQASCIRDPNANLVSFHLPPYLTCPLTCPHAASPESNIMPDYVDCSRIPGNGIVGKSGAQPPEPHPPRQSRRLAVLALVE